MRERLAKRSFHLDSSLFSESRRRERLFADSERKYIARVNSENDILRWFRQQFAVHPQLAYVIRIKIKPRRGVHVPLSSDSRRYQRPVKNYSSKYGREERTIKEEDV